MTVSHAGATGLWLAAAALAAGLAGGVAEASSRLRVAPIEPERLLVQKPTQPGGAQPGQAPRQTPAQPPQQQQQEEEESNEPLRLEPLPSGNELDAFVQRAIRPALEEMRSFRRHPSANGVYQVELSARTLPNFFVNLVEETNVIAPDQAVVHFQRGFGVCRSTTPGERFDEGGLVIQSFTSTCRTQAGNEVFLVIIAGHDDQRTQVLTFMTDPQYADAMRERAEQVYQSIISGS